MNIEADPVGNSANSSISKGCQNTELVEFNLYNQQVNLMK